MFEVPVVFVVGAGASSEYGLPLGGALKDSIAEKLEFRFEYGGSRLIGGDADLLADIDRHVGGDREKRYEYTEAARMLAATARSFISIDEALHYLGATPKAVEIGKVAIVREILEAERNSILSYDKGTGRLVVGAKDGWIGQVMSMAVAGIQREELNRAFDTVTFVNFNYDRAIEQYLYWALQQRMLASANEARQMIERLKMIRPYGSIGPLKFNSVDVDAYGTSAYFDPFARIGNLRTYTEEAHLHDANALEQALLGARLVIFLGFGYHPTNVDLLKVLQATSHPRRILGTSKGLHGANIQTISSRIADNLKLTNSITLFDMEATALLRELRQQILIQLGQGHPP